jgi:CRISPR-associated endonuclease Csy4
MRYYQEITLLPNPEVGLNFLWSKVFQQLHLGFVENVNDESKASIGVSFPKYWIKDKKFGLGDKCRLFALDEAGLAGFSAQQRLSRLTDYVHCTSVRPTPDKVTGYAVFQRVQVKTNPVRLARRYARRKGLDFERAWQEPVILRNADGESDYLTEFRYCEMPIPEVELPFIRLRSLSGGQTFCLWIAKTSAPVAVEGEFTTYGLSRTATVPEF